MDSMIQAIVEATLVSKCVLVLLLAASLLSWAYMTGKWISLHRARRKITAGLARFDAAEALDAGLPLLAQEPESPLFGITQRAIREFNRINSTGDSEKLLNDNVRRALHFGIAEEMGRLSSSLALLATAANTAPFVGLFGTVWGIMHSFHAIAAMKNVSLATVAPGIAEALIATAVGLFVAIPATCGYNVFKSRLGSIQKDCVNFAGVLLSRLQHEALQHPAGLKFGAQRS